MRRSAVPGMFGLAALLGLWGCLDPTLAGGEEDSTSAAARPAGWTEETHGKGATPNYDSLFPQDQVQTLVLELTDSAYQAMWDDMTSLVGTFGSGSGSTTGGGVAGGSEAPTTPDTAMNGTPGGMGGTVGPTGGDTGMAGGAAPSQEALDAAAGKAVGDSCTVSTDGAVMTGTVQNLGGSNVCMGGGGSGGATVPTDTGAVAGGTAAGVGGLGDDAVTNMLSREPVYVPADMHLGGHTWWKIGLRPKGNSSLLQCWQSGSKKLPFRLDIDRFEGLYPEIENERVWGFGKLSLNAATGDASLLRERLASDVFREAGVPTTRESFVKVVMKHGTQTDTLGLYALVEIPDDPFLKQWFGSSSGNLYKPEGTGARFATMVDSTFLADAGDISDVRAMFNALHSDRTDTAAWRARLEATFDVAGFLKWLATNTLVRNWDAYGQMAHNYYLYDDNGRLSWITWDVGLAFQETSQLGTSVWHSGVDSTWPLIHLLLRDSKYRAAYRSDLESILGGAFASSRTVAKVEAWRALVEPSLTSEERSGFASAVSTLETFVRDRATQVQAELAGSNP